MLPLLKLDGPLSMPCMDAQQCEELLPPVSMFKPTLSANYACTSQIPLHDTCSMQSKERMALVSDGEMAR